MKIKRSLHSVLRFTISELLRFNLLAANGGGLVENQIDVTYNCQVKIVPQDVSMHDYMRVMANVDKTEFESSQYRTYLLALSQMNLIRANYGIERELDRYFKRLV